MQRRKVAVIDNDLKLLDDTKAILSMGGYDSILVSDACLAADIVRQHQPDVILIELRMTPRNGFELADELNGITSTRRIPIIAMASSFKNEFSWLMDLCRIKSRLKKPFSPLDLIWAIENEIEEGLRWDREVCLEGVEMVS